MKTDASGKLEAIWRYCPDALLLADVETGRLLDANPQAERLLGRSLAELQTLRYLDLHPAEQKARVARSFAECAAESKIFSDIEIERPDGARIPVEISANAFSDHEGRRLGVASFRDNSARVQAEKAVRRLNWALTAITRANLAATTAETEADMMRLICEGVTTGEIFVLAWIGLAGDAPDKKVTVAAAAGRAAAYLEGLTISWADVPIGQGPTGRAIRQRLTQVNNDAAANPQFRPWCAHAASHGIKSSLATPLLRNGAAFGALTIYSNQINAFGVDEVKLFEDLAREMVLGLDARRHRMAYEAEVRTNQTHTARLRAALEQMVATLAATIEKRDPYTAGHQRRVAEIALRIAQAMGLDEERRQAIYLAGLVHDIGKIYVPGEILNKPGALLQIEFELVKAHAAASYDILQGIDFPWPLASIARQHHERLDGGGYPDGLKGDQISLEARVLAVADVFEAMSSHRPYRPALGNSAAIAELRRQRGAQLDSEVVDVAIRILAAPERQPRSRVHVREQRRRSAGAG